MHIINLGLKLKPWQLDPLMPLVCGGDGVFSYLSTRRVLLVLRVALFNDTERLASEIFGPLSVIHSARSIITPIRKANAVMREGYGKE